MTNNQNPKKKYDLEERTFSFAKAIRIFIKSLPKSLSNIEDSKQLIKASGSIGANYIEANESLGKKDLLMKMKISRKEAKESQYWIRLIKETNSLNNTEEAFELKKIFSSNIEKLK